MFALLLLAAALVVPPADRPVRAVDDASYVECMDKATTTLDYNDCASAALARAVARLNARWQTLQGLAKDYDSHVRASLLSEERAWVAFKNASCQMYWGSGFGSMHRSIVGPQCRLAIVEARVAELDTMIAALRPQG